MGSRLRKTAVWLLSIGKALQSAVLRSRRAIRCTFTKKRLLAVVFALGISGAWAEYQRLGGDVACNVSTSRRFSFGAAPIPAARTGLAVVRAHNY